MENIALVGFMGAGKTVVAKSLSERLSLNLVSTDEMIVGKEGQPITEIFAQKGETYFRSLEKEIVSDLNAKNDLVIDCGGGIVLQDENIENLKKNGRVVYLQATCDTIYNRVKDQSHRPLLNVEDPKKKIIELFEQREPFYKKADIVIDTDRKTVSEVVNEIIKSCK